MQTSLELLNGTGETHMHSALKWDAFIAHSAWTYETYIPAMETMTSKLFAILQMAIMQIKNEIDTWFSIG